MSRTARDDLLQSLPRSFRVRGGDVLRRLAYVVDEALVAAGELVAQGVGSAALPPGVQSGGAAPGATAIDIEMQFAARGLPAPHIWPGVAVEASADGGVVFVRTLGRAVAFVWSDRDFDTRGDAITASARAIADRLPATTVRSAAVLDSIDIVSMRISGQRAAGRLLVLD